MPAMDRKSLPLPALSNLLLVLKIAYFSTAGICLLLSTIQNLNVCVFLQEVSTIKYNAFISFSIPSDSPLIVILP
jgi:hypothetical protein